MLVGVLKSHFSFFLKRQKNHSKKCKLKKIKRSPKKMVALELVQVFETLDEAAFIDTEG